VRSRCRFALRDDNSPSGVKPGAKQGECLCLGTGLWFVRGVGIMGGAGGGVGGEAEDVAGGVSGEDGTRANFRGSGIRRIF